LKKIVLAKFRISIAISSYQAINVQKPKVRKTKHDELCIFKKPLPRPIKICKIYLQSF